MFNASQAGAIWSWVLPAETRKNAEAQKRFVATLAQWKKRLGTETKMDAESRTCPLHAETGHDLLAPVGVFQF